jgi:hypothetical protein
MNSAIKNNLKTRNKKKAAPGSPKTKQEMLKVFFGKLPKIEDGLTYQKKVRNEW